MDKRAARISGNAQRTRPALSRRLRFVFGAAFAPAVCVAAAQAAWPVPGDVVWRCWYPGGTSLSCRLAAAPPSGPRAAVDLDVPLPEGRHPLPPLVRTILRRPAELHGRAISIPLLTQPVDTDFAHELAVAVMCGTNAACKVVFVDSGADASLLLGDTENAGSRGSVGAAP